MNLLTVKNLSVQIEDQVILENLQFELKPGETLSILGPNGAGKTVLLKATGRQLTHTLTKFLIASSAVSVLSVAIGLAVSHYYSQLRVGSVSLNLSLGPAIISVATVFFLLSLLRRKT